jgi:hypothetical protein
MLTSSRDDGFNNPAFPIALLHSKRQRNSTAETLRKPECVRSDSICELLLIAIIDFDSGEGALFVARYAL